MRRGRELSISVALRKVVANIVQCGEKFLLNKNQERPSAMPFWSLWRTRIWRTRLWCYWHKRSRKWELI